MLEQQITEIHGEPYALLGEPSANVLVAGKLHAKAHGVVVINAQSGRPDEHLMGLSLGNGNV